MKLGPRIRQMRRKRKLTQERLAKRANIHVRNLIRLETLPGAQPQFATLRKLASAMRTTLVIWAIRTDKESMTGTPAELLRWARAFAGFGTPRLSKLTGISHKNIQWYETGRRTPLPDTLQKLLRGCGARLRLEFRKERKAPQTLPSAPDAS